MNSLVAYDSSDSETDNDESEEIKYIQKEDNFAHSNFKLQSVFPTTTRLESSGCGLEVKIASSSSNVECNLNSTQNFAQKHSVTSRPAVMTLNDETSFQFSKSVCENPLAVMQKSGRTGKMVPSAHKRLFQDSVTGAQNIKPYVPKRLRQKEAANNKSKELQESTDILNTGIGCTAPGEHQLGLLNKVSDFIKPYLENQHKTSNIPKCLVFQMSQHQGPVTTIQWCPVDQHSHLLLSASMDKSIKIWDAIETGRCLKNYLCHSGAVRDAQWSLCGRQILSGGFDSMLHLTDIETGKQVISFCNEFQITCLAFSPTNQNVFLSGGFSSTVKAWDTRSCKVVNEYSAGIQQTLDILFLPGGTEFLTSTDAVSRDSADRTIIAWDFQTSAKISNQIFHERYTIPCMALHPKEPVFVAQTNGNYMVLFSTQRPYRMNKRKRYEGHKVEGYAVGCKFSHDGTLLASGSSDGTVCFYNYLNSKLVRTLPAHKQACTDVSFHPVHPSIIATSDWSGEIKLWQ
ncbi:WD repeat-containing protein 25 isoform X1 [Pristis pectinata]|uniref:WD repeat-containing protein 25 isoform X1 n=2 Tax=Pristis pectinata TaxID=685728 RepID=UPI00223CA00E|nr:WD repeat-containing protein 25 isoform X1 [Pristis pectinata]XP_051869792.1 WD repeat-containing protein 25 isoform X1 [Pristis pectinata]XP_051869800.1 WD repeat-containing protein 25 isoform X1 [Pristis pectinata]XP_051869809.1 WD repeat-containing protein 25 isoform X1 [Pristis pectinata]XP_051869817.1 WD repeat-containing protein 25 isoform X1 [Pristis pectinata]